MNIELITPQSAFSVFKKRDDLANKGDFGKAMLICGCYGMAGAAVLAAKACLKSGVGLCQVVCPEEIYPIVAASVHEPVFLPFDGNMDKVAEDINKADCVVLGCGMGNTDYTLNMLKTALKCSKVPLIIDADGINVLSQNIELLQGHTCPLVLTPHPGEMARLINTTVEYVQQNRVAVAVEFAKKHNVILVLKGHNTLIALPSGEVFVNTSGNPGMATGGSGDMLCGVMAALVAQKIALSDAVKSAVYIHGLAGDLSAAKLSQISTTPTDMIDCLPIIFSDIERSFQ
ncbi:MAG: NAD(P)H-hydrate dehydratase [Clostridia bacterium]|nr:NAD(P)H-hydrate dehydratase [Clostridia bacterium]